jgi:hypothetical protein
VTFPRTAVLRAADAPAPSIVVDVSGSSHVQDRDQVRDYLADMRQTLMGAYPGIDGLGIKNIAVFNPCDDVLRVEFFQGFAYGPLAPNSQQFCLNSLASALTIATVWFPTITGYSSITALMGGLSFRLRPGTG